MNGYDLSRDWFDFCFENPEKIKPNHSAIYFFAIEHCNRLGWKDKFGLPSSMTMEAIGIKSYNTYIKSLNELVDWGFIKMIERSKNQYSSNIIALSEFDKALDKALDKAFIKHATKQSESTIQSTGESIDSIDKQLTINKEPLTKSRVKKFSPPSLEDIKNQILEKKYTTVSAVSFYNFYESKNWMIGKNKMADWKKALGGWESRNLENNNKPNPEKSTDHQKVMSKLEKYG